MKMCDAVVMSPHLTVALDSGPLPGSWDLFTLNPTALTVS